MARLETLLIFSQNKPVYAEMGPLKKCATLAIKVRHTAFCRCAEWHVDFCNRAAVNDIGKKGLSCEDAVR
jgi:hypothetical protein